VTPPPVYQFEITLLDSEPLIWRRVQVPDATLHSFHHMIQVAMGWMNSHLYHFELDGRRFSDLDPDPESDYGDPPEDSGDTSLGDLGLREGSELLYLYDFGDGWEHCVRMEALLPPSEGEIYPRCLDGARACPPEDVGGIPGYEDFLNALRNPRHPEHAALSEWAPPGFDPEAFDVEETTKRLRSMRQPRSRTRR
jgi:hypothetical protein